MEERNQRIAITIAIIGVIGTLGAALLQNWDKIFGSPPAASATTPAPVSVAQPAAAQSTPAPTASTPDAAPPAVEQATAAAAPAMPGLADTTPAPTTVSGIWRELYPNPGNLAYTTQSGNGFRFTIQGAVQGLSFQAEGTGTLYGLAFESAYQTTLPSSGVCQGTVSSDGMRMESECFDSVYGRYEAASVRQR